MTSTNCTCYPAALTMSVADLTGLDCAALLTAFHEADEAHGRAMDLSDDAGERAALAILYASRALLIDAAADGYANLATKLALVEHELERSGVDRDNADYRHAWAALDSVRRGLVLLPEHDRQMQRLAENDAAVAAERKAGDLLTRARKARAEAEALEREAQALEGEGDD